MAAKHIVISKDGTRIGFLSTGAGPSVLVVPGVLSMAADYAASAHHLAARLSVHTIERRGRGESGPQGDDYSIVKECDDVRALQAQTDATLLVGHSYGGLVALEVARNNSSFTKNAVTAGVLLMHGGKSDSKAVTLGMERLATLLPHSETKEFPALDHFGIERTAPREVAEAVSDFFLKLPSLAYMVGK